MPAPAAQFLVPIGKMPLRAPEPLGLFPRVLGLECRVSALGMRLSEAESIFGHLGTACSWPDVLPSSIARAPERALAGDDDGDFVLSAMVEAQRHVVSTTPDTDAGTGKAVVIHASHGNVSAADWVQDPQVFRFVNSISCIPHVLSTSPVHLTTFAPTLSPTPGAFCRRPPYLFRSSTLNTNLLRPFQFPTPKPSCNPNLFDPSLSTIIRRRN